MRRVNSIDPKVAGKARGRAQKGTMRSTGALPFGTELLIVVPVEEGQKMVQAARKYQRVVQAGTMQRSGIHFQQACEIVRSGPSATSRPATRPRPPASWATCRC